MSDQNTRMLLQALKGLNVVYAMYPAAVAGGGAAPIGLVVADGGANTFAACTNFIAINTITTEYWFCAVSIGAAAVAETYVADVMAPIDVTSIYSFRCGISAVTANICQFGPPFPVRIAANVALGARTASNSGGDSLTMSILVATGM